MLDERKLAILTEIVDYYINHAEPIGSRTLSKNLSFGLSSATIRNEMSDLEDLGYLMKTHVSSGRIPSDKAYRLYVNNILDEINLNKKFIESLKENLQSDYTSLNNFYEEANKLLSQKTNYITMIVSPLANSYTIEFVKLELLSENRLLLILVGRQWESSSYIISNYGIEEAIKLVELERILKELILNKEKEELRSTLKNIPEDFPNREFYIEVGRIALKFLEDKNSYHVYLNGIGNSINLWEKDKDIKSLLDFLEDDSNIIRVSMNKDEANSLDVSIGVENEDEILQDSSIIVADYENAIGNMGNIILIGPTRMDYKKLANILYNFSITLSGIK